MKKDQPGQKTFYAYSVLDTKASSETDDFVYVEGIASTPTPDRTNDVVDPMGAKFKTPMPFLLYHDSNKPVGELTFAEPNKKGVPFKAKIPKVKEPGAVKDRVDEAIHSLKYGLIKAVSIGFKVLAFEFRDDGGWNINEWEWLELSLVTIPAQSEAVITAVKSADREALTALGHIRVSESQIKESPGVTGTKSAQIKRPVLLIPPRKLT